MARLTRIGGVAVVLALAGWVLWPREAPESLSGNLGAGKAAATPAAAGDVVSATARQRYAQSLMAFEPNQGQTDPAVKYFARGAGYSLFLTPTEAVFRLRALTTRQEAQRMDRVDPIASHRIAMPAAPAAVVRMSLVGANRTPTLDGQDKQPGVSNYFLDKDPAKWHRDVPQYGQVQYNAVYPGVDLVYYGNQQQLEYDFVVAPGADPAQITLAYQGVDELRLDQQGNLILGAGKGELVQHRPVAYQEIAGEQKSVEADYTLFANYQVGIRLGAYDHGEPLVIDPVLAYGTYFGASGNDDAGIVAVDRAGNSYLTGSTDSTDFPMMGAYQDTNAGGGYDVFVSKLNAAGSALVYSTYLGGTGTDSAVGLAVDASGNAVVSGTTYSSDFPTTVGALKTTYAGTDVFVTKLNAAGNDLVYSTFLGGSNGELGGALALDGSSNAYIAGSTYSDNFPMVGAIQASLVNGPDAFVAKLNAAGTALIYSTYLGGSGDDAANGIAVDSSGNAYVAGYTASTNFPRVAARQNTYGGGAYDCFVSKLNAAGSALVYSTYHGGSSTDIAYGIAVSSAGNAVVVGYTGSTSDFPLASARQGTYGGGTSDAFISMFNAAGSALVYSTFHGGAGYDYGYRVGVDRAGNAYVVGYASDLSGFPLVASSSYYNPNNVGVYLSKFRADGAVLAYSTLVGYFAGNNDAAVVVDKLGTAYVTAKVRYSVYQTATPLQPNCSANCSGPNLKEDITFSKIATPLAQPWAGDFDGDGKDDILWHNNSTGQNVIWKSAISSTQQAVTTVSNLDSIIAGIGDFDGDGKADIFWRNVETGTNVIWKSGNSATPQAVAGITDFNWRIVGTGDFNGDGKADILWHNQLTGASLIWRSGSNTTQQAMTTVTNLAWDIVGIGDFNNDGKADVLWRHNSSGQNVIWLSANSPTQQTVTGVTDVAWRVVGVADVNGDAKTDIVWRNASTGANTIWLSALSSTQQAMPTEVHAWRVLGVGDYNGDGHADVLWRNTATGLDTIWKSGKSSTPQATTGVTNTDWWPQS